MKRLALLVAVLFVPAGSASAVTVIDPQDQIAQPWQALARQAKVPTIPGTVRVVGGDCPWAADRLGCIDFSAPPTIYIRRGWDEARAFYHELGHAFDRATLTDGDRAAFLAIMRATGRPWFPPPGTFATYSETNAPGEELFAEGYALCARLRSLGRFGQKRQDITGYGYDPTPGQHRKVCALIRRAGGWFMSSSGPVNGSPRRGG